MTKQIFCALIAAVSLSASPHALAGLEWETTKVTVPATFGEATLEATYSFKNTGTEPVRIREVKTSCGCTYAAASRELIKPGESAEVAAFFETGDREGAATLDDHGADR